MGNIVPFLPPPPLPLLPHVGDLTSVFVIIKHSFPCQVTSDIMVPIKKPTGKQDVDSISGDGRNPDNQSCS